METDSWKGTRTVVVSGVPDVLPVSRMTDKLTIHFQSYRRSRGGDVEVVRYPTNMDGVAFVTFEKVEEAERVVRKEQQIMMDNEFPDDFLLTVFPFTKDVFLYVPSAMVDLSVFGRDQSSLIQSLRLAHRSLCFRPFHQQMKATIEGPFAAIQGLRQDLICRANQLKSTVSAQTAAAKLKEAPPNPGVISHQEVVGSVSCSGPKAKLGPAGSNCLSTPLQTTGEATEVQSLLSNAKTQNVSSRQKVSHESLAVGSFCNSDREEKRDRSNFEIPSEYRTDRTKANPRQMLKTGIRSLLLDQDLLVAEEMSAKQPGKDDISEKHHSLDRSSATKIRENHTGSCYSSTDNLKGSDQRSSAFTANILQTRLTNLSTSSKSDTEDTKVQPAVCPEDQEDTCVWVDTYTFRYIETFDKKTFDRCLRGLDVSVECEGSDLTRIVLTERQTSKTASRIQQASEDLRSLVEFWLSRLRVQQIDYAEEEQPEKQKLIQICEDVNLLYANVLYMLEDSCIRVIGPAVSSHLFCERVEDRIVNTKTF